MLFWIAAASAACPTVVDALGGDQRWSQGGVTIEGRFTESGAAGRFVQYESPEGVTLIRTFDHGAVAREVLAGPAPADRWLVEPSDGAEPLEDVEPAAGPDAVRCSWQLGGEERVVLQEVDGVPRLRRGTLCNGIEFSIDATDWRQVDGAPFPHRLVVQPAGGPVYAELIAERVTRGVPADAFAAEAPSPYLTASPRHPLPLEVRDERPFVEVELSGPAGSRKGWMMLDTGWTTTGINHATAEALGLVSAKDAGARSRDAAGRTLVQRAATLDRLAIGDGVWEQLPVTLVDGFDGEGVMGVLGNAAFEGQALRIHGVERTAHWSPSPERADGLEASYCGALLVEAEVAGRSGSYVIDTGAWIDVVYASTNGERNRIARDSGGGRPTAVAVASGTVEARKLGPADVSIAGHQVHNASAVITTRDAPDRVGLMGWSTLRCFATTLDYGNERVHFELVGDPEHCATLVAEPRTWGGLLTDAVLLGTCCGLPLSLIPIGILRRRRLKRIYAGDVG